MNKHKLYKEQKPKLSVVVIAFNNELYIEEALESLNEQTYKDMEIVVVNDFSSDKTGEIINDYIADKPQFKAIHLNENSGGCSVPRNTGILNTTGDYIMFLDGDDWYTPKACEKMVEAITRTDSDFVAGQVIRTNNYEIWYHKQIYSKERININVREFTMLLFDSLSVNKIYKRSFLDKNKLSFPEGIHYEDIVFTGKAYFLADSISIIPEPIYYWRVVEDSEVKSITNRRDDFVNFKNRIISHRMFDEFLFNNGDYIYQAPKNNKFLRHDLKLYLNDYPDFNDEYKTKFFNLSHQYLTEVMDKYEFLKLPTDEKILYYFIYINDKKAFDEYVLYRNNDRTTQNRVLIEEGNYYFKPSFWYENDKKFVLMNPPIINYSIQNCEFKNNNLSFYGQAHLNSVNKSEFNFYWILKNKYSKENIRSEFINGKNTFNLDGLSYGDYNFFLVVNHYGVKRNILVKYSEVSGNINLNLKSKKSFLSLLVSSKDSLLLRVRPQRVFSKIKWEIDKRRYINKSISNTKKSMVLEKLIKNLIRKLPVSSKLVIFESHMGKQYSDSPKYIYQRMINDNLKYKYIWSFENPFKIDLPGNPKKVKRGSLKHFYYLNRAKYWVDNQGIAHMANKKRNQIYLQTWHGTPLKKMGYDQENQLNNKALARLSKQVNSWDFFVSPNAYSTEIFKKAFRYPGEILQTGYPRNDILLNYTKNDASKIRDILKLPVDKNIVLFAPTFRDWKTNSVESILADVKEISENTNDDSVILLRLHYLLAEKLKDFPMPSNVRDVSDYDDIQELFIVTDILITDYSSLMFDFSVLCRPIILYCYDWSEYAAKRGVYFNLEKNAPGPFCYNVEQIISFLQNPSLLKDYSGDLKNFRSKFSRLENGESSLDVIKKVFK
ncbi:glycosyltransferase [Virgibacillus halodenitrificans]|uniref:bifunctional glycosyltransferase/CDP-glycerol:glycerophosphate glycerophosphotransferase n=1 Tax=Virgibacillus halodenitrificans TaxID=1482 RepID=UPI00136CBD54|nr:bifunctional glycosyltransferase family 2 protein/CDP-glycerol:glycerophosphate glycerophosphotransferase [Virgibacillus halodenitrificans]MYL47792.1 glycosyltransferase [Virgibacillus halodenitrificans]